MKTTTRKPKPATKQPPTTRNNKTGSKRPRRSPPEWPAGMRLPSPFNFKEALFRLNVDLRTLVGIRRDLDLTLLLSEGAVVTCRRARDTYLERIMNHVHEAVTRYSRDQEELFGHLQKTLKNFLGGKIDLTV
jgi:hypothetical protein